MDNAQKILLGVHSQNAVADILKKKDPNADPRDQDGDGMIYDGTDRERPARQRPQQPKPRKPQAKPEKPAKPEPKPSAKPETKPEQKPEQKPRKPSVETGRIQISDEPKGEPLPAPQTPAVSRSETGESTVAELQSLHETGRSRSSVRYFSEAQKDHKTILDLGRFFDQQQESRGGKLVELSEENAEILSETIVDEILYAISQDDSAVGWYDEKMKAAMGVIEKLHPELSDPVKKSFYTSLIAITSNGQSVIANFVQADKLYQGWKDTGKIEDDLNWGGKERNAINGKLKMMNDMIAEHGLEKTVEFLDTTMTVRELKDATGIKVGNEQMSHVVKGSMVFGPKLGAFYSNLNGDFSHVTMDRWFLRTIHRSTGTMYNPSYKAAKGQAQRLIGEGRHGKENILQKLSQEELFGFDREKLIDQAKRIGDGTLEPHADMELIQWTRKTRLKDAAENFKNRNEKNKAAATLYKNFNSINETASGRERTWIRTAMKKAQDRLREEHGVEINYADMQASLWYHEKELYNHMGIASERSMPADYLDAAQHLMKTVNNEK